MRRAVLTVAAALAACHEPTPPTADRAFEAPPPSRSRHHYALPAANLDVIWRGAAATQPQRAVPEAIEVRGNSNVGLEGVDSRSGSILWQLACSDSSHDGVPCMGRLERHGDIAVYAGTLWYNGPGGAEGAFGIDVRTGRERWRVRTDFEDELSTKLAVDGDRAYLMAWSHVVALDLATGERVWERRTEPREMTPSRGRQLAAGEGVVAFAGSSDAIHLVDPRTGADRATLPWSGFVGDLLIRDGVLYAVPMWGHAAEAIVAYDVATGRERWRHDQIAAWAIPPAFLDDDALYVRRSADVVRAQNDEGTELVALDRETGDIVWEHALGHVTAFAALAAPDGPSTLVAQTGPESIVFARQAAPAAKVEATVSGTVRLDGLHGPLDGLRVAVGGVTALTDATGAFSARVRAHGAIEISLKDMPPVTDKHEAPVVADPAFVQIDKLASAYRVELVVHEISPWPPD